MSLMIDTFSGTPRDIGRSWGHAYRHFIQALYWEGNACHHPHPVEPQLNDLAERAIVKLKRYAPGYFAEVEAAAPECGLSVAQLALRMDNFCYARGPLRAPAAQGCFQIGVLSQAQGPVVGSIMDSPRVCFAWWRVRPAGGYAHLALTTPGTATSDRGMNEHGLVVSESSTPNTGADYEPDLLLHPLATRLVLEQCRTVREAVALITALPVSHAYVFADAQGGLLGVQTTPAGYAVYEPGPAGIVLANHIRDAALLAKIAARGYNRDYRNAESELRVSTAEAMIRAHGGDHDTDFVRSVLSSHTGYPDSICRDGNGSTFIAAPVADARGLLIAERFPCAQPFERYAVTE